MDNGSGTYRLVVGTKSAECYQVLSEVFARSSMGAALRIAFQVVRDGGLPPIDGSMRLWVEYRPLDGDNFSRISDMMQPGSLGTTRPDMCRGKNAKPSNC